MFWTDNLMRLLLEIKEDNTELYQMIHKGVPFTQIATSAFYSHDFDTAIYFLHSAAAQDLALRIKRNEPLPEYCCSEFPDISPAINFMVLQKMVKSDQAINLFIEIVQSVLDKLVQSYRGILRVENESITVEYLSHEFLFEKISKGEPYEWFPVITSFHVFLLEWQFRRKYMELNLDHRDYSPFYHHLFKGCVLLESLLKDCPNPENILKPRTMGRFINTWKSKLGFSCDVNADGDLNEVLTGITESRIESIDSHTIFEVAVRTRNSIGHRLVWDVELTIDLYDKLVKIIMFANLHVIYKLYLNQPEDMTPTQAS